MARTTPWVACCLGIVAISLACGGDTFESSLAKYGAMGMVVVGEPGCDANAIQAVIEQRIDRYSAVHGAVSIHDDGIHVMLSGESIDENLPPLLIQPYQLQLIPVLTAPPPSAAGHWLADRNDPSVLLAVADQPSLTNDDVRAAHLNADTPQPIVNLSLTEAGAATFADLTASMIGQQLAIVVDDTLISAPFINERIAGGRVHISGMQWEEAAWLAAALNVPPLPCEVTVTYQALVPPTNP